MAWKATVIVPKVGVFRQAGLDGRVRGVRLAGAEVIGSRLVENHEEDTLYLKFGFRRFLPIRTPILDSTEKYAILEEV